MPHPPVVPDIAETDALERDVAVAPDHVRGRLATRPHPPSEQGRTGTVALGVVAERDTVVEVPAGYRPDRPAPLLLILHGSGGDARGAVALVQGVAAEAGAILLAPSSRDRTWDMLVGNLGPDVAVIDRSLDRAFDRLSVDPARIYLAGFSDGASYALTLGLANGDLFGHVLAFSPGFSAVPVREGKPRIFVSHGTADKVLPIARCSRRIVQSLQIEGYDVRYVEFAGGHTLPGSVARDGLTWAGLLV
jgi:phospholipase/carboxylesterase